MVSRNRRKDAHQLVGMNGTKEQCEAMDAAITGPYAEQRIQQICIKWFRKIFPGMLIYSIPNEGKRGMVQAVQMKRAGLEAGIPDIHLPLPREGYSSLYIEMKIPARRTGKNKGVSDKQAFIHEWLRNQGNKVVVCYGRYEFKQAIEEYLKCY